MSRPHGIYAKGMKAFHAMLIAWWAKGSYQKDFPHRRFWIVERKVNGKKRKVRLGICQRAAENTVAIFAEAGGKCPLNCETIRYYLSRKDYYVPDPVRALKKWWGEDPDLDEEFDYVCTARHRRRKKT